MLFGIFYKQDKCKQMHENILTLVSRIQCYFMKMFEVLFCFIQYILKVHILVFMEQSQVSILLSLLNNTPLANTSFSVLNMYQIN